LTDTTCPIPPTGWYCTRRKGHPGPCAAVPEPELSGSGALPSAPGTVIDVLGIDEPNDLVVVERFVRLDDQPDGRVWLSLLDRGTWVLDGGDIGWNLVSQPPGLTLMDARRHGVPVPDTLIPAAYLPQEK
jgi:hypothetical protein